MANLGVSQRVLEEREGEKEVMEAVIQDAHGPRPDPDTRLCADLLWAIDAANKNNVLACNRENSRSDQMMSLVEEE